MADKYMWDKVRDTVWPVKEIDKWMKQFEDIDRQVGNDKVKGYEVSTVFLGTDHKFRTDELDAPLIFETMVFDEDSGFDEFCYRCATPARAREVHERVLRMISVGGKEGLTFIQKELDNNDF